MKLCLKLRNVPYGELAVQAMPLLLEKVRGEKTAAAKILTEAASLPDFLICEILNAVPAARKNDIISSLVSEQQEKLLEMLHPITEPYGMVFTHIYVGPDLSAELTLGEPDFERLLDVLFPDGNTQPGMQGGMLGTVLRMPRGLVRGFIRKLSPSQKESLAVHLICAGEDRILEILTEHLEEKGISVTIDHLTAVVS